MADIFLSYTEQDREQARRVATMLESVGWSVWWDRRIPAGETWRGVLEKALGNMRCMIVLWSARSIESEWVYEEATEGRRLGKLVPVMIEAVRPPAGFREIQAADLTNWDCSREFDGMRMLITDLENLLGKPVPAAAVIPEKPTDKGQPYDPADLAGGGTTTSWWRRYRLPVMATAGTLLVAGAVYLGVSSREPAVVTPQVREPTRNEAVSKSLPAEPAPSLPAPSRSTPEVAAVTPPQPAPPPADAEIKTSPVVKPPSKPAQVLVDGVIVTTPPVAKLPPKERAAVKRSETTRTTSSRCADLLYKIQLGESLSYEDQSVFRKECQQ